MMRKGIIIAAIGVLHCVLVLCVGFAWGVTSWFPFGPPRTPAADLRHLIVERVLLVLNPFFFIELAPHGSIWNLIIPVLYSLPFAVCAYLLFFVIKKQFWKGT